VQFPLGFNTSGSKKGGTRRVLKGHASLSPQIANWQWVGYNASLLTAKGGNLKNWGEEIFCSETKSGGRETFILGKREGIGLGRCQTTLVQIAGKTTFLGTGIMLHNQKTRGDRC